MSRIVGTRVVRGPHWQWQTQDGGEGGLGTVVATTGASTPATRAVVLWDCGTKASYRIGEDSAYDLRIIDNAACGVRHQSVSCNSCKHEEIAGIRWKCKVCSNYNLCTTCYMADQHDVTHAFLRITEPASTAAVVSQRKLSTQLESKGICPGAIVTRSADWKWGDQDGGKGQTGVVTELSNWPGNCQRDAVRVNWSATQRSDLYRFGHDGKVDVVATTAQLAGKYYPQHLPNLGEPEKKQTASLPVVPNRLAFAIGDKVRVNVPAQVLAKMQDGHGGWRPEMQYVVEKVGVVQAFNERGDVQVEFDSKSKWVLNPAALTKFTKASVGDIVKIISNATLAKALQAGHGEWVDIMTQALGKLGKVHSCTPNGDLRVQIGRAVIVWNPECCTEPTNADKENYEAEVPVTSGASSEGLSAAVKEVTMAVSCVSLKESFEVGDVVTIINDATQVKQLQDGHGGWTDEMEEALGETGKVLQVTADGSLQIRVAGRKWWFNSACCSKAASADGDGSNDEEDDGEDPRTEVAKQLLTGLVAAQLQVGLLRAVASLQEPRFKVGDIVRIDRDVTRVKLRQRGHGGWNDMMLLALGKAGKVIGIDSDGDVQVNTGHFNWTFNPECLEPVTEAEVGDCLIC